MPKRKVPPPPDFTKIEPLIDPWPAGTPFVRVYDPSYPPNGFNPGPGKAVVKGRFHFFEDETGGVVPALYGAATAEAAIAETIFHDTPVKGFPRVVFESRLVRASMVSVAPSRELRLVELHGFGLRRLEVTPEELTSTSAATYSQTIPWARALHQGLPDTDGLVWMSKQFNSAKAIVLFGDRVTTRELSVVDLPLPLLTGPGRTFVDMAANRAGILILP